MTIERTENSHTWHPDVQFYSLKKDGKQKAFFYLDPYSRPAGVLQCALQGSSVNHTADVASRKLWNYRCHMYVDCRPFGRVSHAQKPFSRRCLQCGGSGKSLRQSIWVGSAGGMQVGVQKAESSQHARQLHEALQCHLDAEVCRGLHAEKRGGAWMDEVVGQSRLMAPAGESVRLPVGHMVCNQTPPVGDQPSLMTFRVRALPCALHKAPLPAPGCRLLCL